MRGFSPLWIGLFLLAAAAPAAAKTVTIADGTAEVQVTDRPVQSRCVVVVSSGSNARDADACARALAAVPVEAGGLPPGAFLFPGRDRLYADGACVEAGGAPVADRFAAACAAMLKTMGEARVAMAIDPETWVRPGDLRSRDVHGGSINLSIGVGPDGKASYCVPIRSSGSDRLDKTLCAAILERARFEPALDEKGRPMPSAYARQFRFPAAD
ncbi:MAG TPA: energy transducer TonB [Allosphingosinicella sp.]